MSAIFPSQEWLKELESKLNSDEKYRGIAKDWEGDLLFNIEPEGNLKEPRFYLDLGMGPAEKWITTLIHRSTQSLLSP